jgi:hypothetical protein
MHMVGLLSLATALPPDIVEQSVAKAKARKFYGGSKAVFDRLSSVFDMPIAQRHRRPDRLVRTSRVEGTQPALSGCMRRTFLRRGGQGD